LPGNISIVTLPAKSPALNLQEHIWQFMLDNCLWNWVFASHNDTVDHCRYAWKKLVDQPWRIISVVIAHPPPGGGWGPVAPA
jgi:hypothetical protein